MRRQATETDPLPADPRARIDTRIDAILRRFEPREDDMGTIRRRHAARELYDLAREAVDLDVQREVTEARKALDEAREQRRKDDGVIRVLHYALLYYREPQSWWFGCAIHVNAFDVDDVRLDEGECARDALRSVASAFPR